MKKARRAEDLKWFTDANTGYMARKLPAQVMRSHTRTNFEQCPLCGAGHEQGHDEITQDDNGIFYRYDSCRSCAREWKVIFTPTVLIELREV